MKIFACIFPLFLGAHFNANAQNVTIPDANFKAALVANMAINTNGDSEIQVTEANSYTGGIALTNPFSIVSDLTGIEAFVQLTALEVLAISLPSVNLSQNTNLDILTLYGYSNQLSPLSVLDLGNNTLLTQVNCSATSISALDLSSNTQLQVLNTSASPIANLSISNCLALSELYVGSGQLSTLNVTNNTALVSINCSNNQLTSLDVSNCGLLTNLNCSDNLLTNLDIANNNNSAFTSFSAVNNPSLNCIKASDVAWCYNNFTSANGFIDANATFSFDCNQCYVNIPDANLKSYLLGDPSINVNGDTEIECAEALLPSSVQCIGQNISDLTGIEAFTNITTLRFSFNQVTSVDLSSNVNIEWLDCQNNLLTTLDLTANTALDYVEANDNQLTHLNIANGYNTLIPVNGFITTNNPSLTCIQVDDVSYSTNNWTDIDAQTNFDTNCMGILVNSIAVQGQGGTSSIATQGGTLQMEAVVLPADANDPTYTWSVTNGTGSASIDVNGLLTAISDGTVDVIATANDASGVTGATTVVISNQNVGLHEISSNVITIYPNPVADKLFIKTGGKVTEITILDISGSPIQTIKQNTKQLNVSMLSKGIYILRISTDGTISNIRFVKK